VRRSFTWLGAAYSVLYFSPCVERSKRVDLPKV
jgi:hypothetical protein